jgi:ribosomal protein L12E/L44/L45/RPP1/RPP2
VLGESSTAKRSLKTAQLLGYGFHKHGWKSLFPLGSFASLPEGTYDRAEVRAANLDKRLKDCLDPEPATIAAVVASLDQGAAGSIAEWGAEKVVSTAIAAAPAKTKAQAKRTTKQAGKRGGKKQVADDGNGPALSFSAP